MAAEAEYYPQLGLRIAGHRGPAEGGQHAAVVNPADESVLGVLPLASDVDIARALGSLEDGFAQWRRTPPDARSDVLRKAACLMRERRERISRVATLESGKPIGQSRAEVETAAQLFEWFAEEGRRAYGRVLPQRCGAGLMTVVRDPVGPVAAFAPWNFPVVNPARKLGAALGAGCSVILKADEETPASALMLADALYEAGLPPSALSVVFGEPAAVSGQVLSSPVIRKLSFTGSTAVGKLLMRQAADRMIRTTMELGGHAPVIVCDDVDPESMLDAAVAAKFRSAGQACISPTRFYVHESRFEAFVNGFVSRTRALVVGDGLDERADVGPLIHARRRDAVDALVRSAIRQGAALAAGGGAVAGPGYFYEPTVLTHVPEKSGIMNEEPFGPVALVNPFADLDEVIAKANRLPFGLAAYVFSGRLETVRKLTRGIEAGMTGVNGFSVSLPESPFGGVKESGHGSEQGIEGLEACLVTRFICEN